ncbi:LacI family DNA-binding transcriptional regulator [Chitinophagaceae bacterium 26-R-25]|nr:LacI family DNA-binding transcriptional regulator [Chitinophagaceae bacterium 26-R-25]
MRETLPTLKEIAKRLDVSASTVSRALVDNPRIGLGTRLKVQKMAEELGYERNTQAVNFKLKRTNIIGVIVPYVREEFFSDAICGIEEVASQHNYTILFGQSYDDVNNEMRLIEIVKKKRVDGLIISLSKSTSSTSHIDALSRFNIPVVYFDRVPEAGPVNKVYCDVYSGMCQIVTKLVSNGITRIALINGPGMLTASKDRLNGYVECMENFKLKVDMRMVSETDFSVESTHGAMRSIMNVKVPPQAVISVNDYVHMDAVQYARSHKIKVNNEVIFVSLSNLPITSYTIHPPLIALKQHPHKQGAMAMNMLLQIFEDKLKSGGNLEKPRVQVISPTLVQCNDSKAENSTVFKHAS